MNRHFDELDLLDFALKVETMTDLQQAYYRTRSPEALAAAKKAEGDMRTMIAAIKAELMPPVAAAVPAAPPGSLFGGSTGLPD